MTSPPEDRPPRAAPPTREVEIVEGERVEGRGRVQVRWFVHHRGAWRPAAAWPSVERELLSPGPGTVWEARLRLRLPVGARLAREELRPRADPRDALAHLDRATRSPARKLSRTEHVVGADGRLGRVDRGE